MFGYCGLDTKCKAIRQGTTFIADPQNESWCGLFRGCPNLPPPRNIPNCVMPEATPEGYEVIPTGGTYTVRRLVRVKAPYNWWVGEDCHPIDGCLSSNPWKNTSRLELTWSNSGGSVLGFCQYQDTDEVLAYRQQTGLTCAGAPYTFPSYQLRASVCSCANPLFCSSCGFAATVSVDFQVSKGTLGCPVPRKDDCRNCRDCVPTGGGCNVGVGGKGLTCKVPAAGAHLYYAAGGAGNTGFPGTAAWTPVLGRNWSHDYAQRIILDPNDSHVWLITPTATFREWSGLSGGVYNTVSPSDEKRTLRRTAGGWELAELDGRVHFFNSLGLWTQTVDKNGNAKTATYNGANQLTSVSFPDQRSETFTYHPSGKLASLTETGVGGSPTRTWTYTWSGDDLVRVDRPDGTAWEFFYHATLPGALVRRDLISTGLVRRVEGAWDYDSQGNVIKAWRGDPAPPSSPGSNAVEPYTFSYDNPFSPTETQMTDPLGKVTTYTIARDTVSEVPKVTRIQGDCPTCGTGPNAQFTYGDPANPLLATQMIDGRGLRTQYAFDAKGQMTSKTEAAGLPLARTTTWQYANPAFPAFPTRIERPSTSGGAALRTTVLTYNATGDLQTQTEQGAESGGSFTYTTATTFNAAGQPLTIDPPGHAAADQTTFTYDPARANLLPLTRTDPLTGTTTFGYDGFNRRTSVTDANGVETVSTYDNLHRVTSVTQKGATVADDLVTTYEYNAFGDLFRITLPRGNVIEHGYDVSGRLISIERKPNAATHGERTFYTLNSFGHRVKEELQHWDGTAFVTDSFTEFIYGSRCQLDKTVHADGTVTEYAYDCNGNLERAWDANHPRATNPIPAQLYTYDSLNRLSTLTQPWTGAGGSSAVTTYAYDVQDHLTGVTDAEGNATTYTYSDRDLLTQQVSPVSGTTVSTYDEHGELVTTTDARGIVNTRTVDAADRLTQQTFGPAGSPDPALTTTYAYGSTPAQFNVGRLTGITRNGQTIAYTYDRFGRVLEDGSLTYGYDKNGNRTTITYPGGVSALYTHDFADRESTLSYNTGSGPQPLVTSAGYKPLGPLSSLTFANGLSETRLFDERYFPDRIQAGALQDWDYTEDAVGNPTQITGTIAGQPYTATFTYQDPQYFLTGGNGPWGTRAWTYDRIGNRLTHQESGEPPQTYTYAGTGHNPKLLQITPAPGLGAGVRQYAYDAAGNQISVQETDEEGSMETTFLDVSPESRLSALRPTTAPGRTGMVYDGRGYLRQAHLTFTGSAEDIKITPTYSSEGLLMSRAEDRNWSGDTPGPDGEDSLWLVHNDETTHLFYFAGRPVAQLTDGALFSITTDHLGTPVLITNSSGTPVWAGGLEPFGRPWTAGGNPDPEPLFAANQTDKGLSRLSSESAFLRYPGQWASDAFRVGGVRMEVYYNVHRWYEVGTGRYGQVDPYPELVAASYYSYAGQSPLSATDPLGLFVVDSSCDCERKLPDNIHRALGRAKQWAKSPSCAAALAKHPQVKKCLEDRFNPAQTGAEPLIICHSTPPPEGNVCGGYTPQIFTRPPAIHLFPGHPKCPRNNPQFGVGATILHEALHSCGMLSESQAAEVTKSCTGFDARL